jgi:hypothetical protein
MWCSCSRELQRFPVIGDHSVIPYDRKRRRFRCWRISLSANRIHFAGTCASPIGVSCARSKPLLRNRLGIADTEPVAALLQPRPAAVGGPPGLLGTPGPRLSSEAAPGRRPPSFRALRFQPLLRHRTPCRFSRWANLLFTLPGHLVCGLRIMPMCREPSPIVSIRRRLLFLHAMILMRRNNLIGTIASVERWGLRPRRGCVAAEGQPWPVRNTIANRPRSLQDLR